MRTSIRPRLIVAGLILAVLASLGNTNLSRRLRADELQRLPQERDLTDSENSDSETPDAQNPTPANPDGENQTAPPKPEKKASSNFNWATKTGGGTQLWTDHCFRDGFRVQQNALTGHWRILDPRDVRRGWGSEDHCRGVLDQIHPEEGQAETPKHYVVLLHGLMRSHHSMKPVAAALAEQGHEDVIRFAYASTRSSISDHSAALREVLEDLPDGTQFSFVGHSMGNIVVRHMLGRLQEDDPEHLLTRFHSMVMLGPPNQGAAISRRLAPTGLYGWITGKGGMELGPQWESFAQQLATPSFPFLIIAGDVSQLPLPMQLKNPLVDGSSDFVVSVDEARLEGAEALETVPVLHSFLMNDSDSLQLTVDFLMSH
ncbi:MAG: alpha/beta fold hydrolase [Planctomycetota bacterium]